MRWLRSAARCSTTKLALVLALGGLAAVACGGSASNAHESSGQYTLKVLRASFPSKQAVARPAALELEVENAGANKVPNVAVTVVSFYYRSEFPNLSEHARPIWIVDQGPGAIPQRAVETVLNSPGGYTTATSSTWAAGPLAPGEARTFTWMLTPVKSGTHTVAYTLAAGLGGKAHAQLPGGGPVVGHFQVEVAPAPPATHVNPETGVVEHGSLPVAPGP